MALSKCTECGKEVSDKAMACPHCGAPVPALTQEEREQRANNLVQQSLFARSRYLGGTVFWAGIAWLAAVYYILGADAFGDTFSKAMWPILGGLLWYVLAEIQRNLYEQEQRKRKG